MTQSRFNGRLQLVLLGLLFSAPLAMAIVLFFFAPDWRPEGSTNYGELVHPAQPLPEPQWLNAEGETVGLAAIRGHWNWVMLVSGACDGACETELYDLRQTRMLLNEKRLRLRRILLVDDVNQLEAMTAQLGEVHPDLQIYAPAVGDTAAAAFPEAAPGTVFVVDPLGNLMMRYAPQPDLRKVLKDIKRLMRVSQIG
jgi:cytochrome oxidase Cu insertion factor (SCO1/SenC/PrrC family)